MRDDMNSSVSITEETNVGLYAVVTAIPALVFVVFFITQLSAKADATEARVDRQSAVLLEQREMLIEIRENIAAIKAILEHRK